MRLTGLASAQLSLLRLLAETQQAPRLHRCLVQPPLRVLQPRKVSSAVTPYSVLTSEKSLCLTLLWLECHLTTFRIDLRTVLELISQR